MRRCTGMRPWNAWGSCSEARAPQFRQSSAGQGQPKPRPWLRCGEGLQELHFGAAQGLSRASGRCLQRLGLQRWAFRCPLARGGILVSRPLFPCAGQPELVRSVILIVQHDHTGTTGMVLNKHCKLELELEPWLVHCVGPMLMVHTAIIILDEGFCICWRHDHHHRSLAGSRWLCQCASEVLWALWRCSTAAKTWEGRKWHKASASMVLMWCARCLPELRGPGDVGCQGHVEAQVGPSQLDLGHCSVESP